MSSTPTVLLLPASGGMGAEAREAQVLSLFGAVCHSVMGGAEVMFSNS
jgi:hypothetical protein